MNPKCLACGKEIEIRPYRISRSLPPPKYCVGHNMIGKKWGENDTERVEKYKKRMTNKSNPFWGKHHTEKTKEKIRQTHLGRKQSEKEKESHRLAGIKNRPVGKFHHSEETKKKMSERAKRVNSIKSIYTKTTRSDAIKKKWANTPLDIKEEIFRKVIAVGKPNQQELELDGIIKSVTGKDFIFSGNGKIWIEGKCPDWFNVNGRKQVIEFFGDYYHGEAFTGRTRDQEEERRKEHFRRFGYDCLIIWGHELKDKNKVMDRIRNF